MADDDFHWIDADSPDLVTAAGFWRKAKPPKLEEQVVYSVKSMEALQSNHSHLLQNKQSMFFFKNTNSSMQYDISTGYWTEISKQDPMMEATVHLFDKWIPITACIESIHGSGAYMSRYITLYIHATVENAIGGAPGFPPIFVYLSGGISLGIGVRVGVSKLYTLLFSCSINAGEVAQLFVRPSFIKVPDLKIVKYKFKKKRLNKVGTRYIKSFKMLALDAPEHQCWVSRDVSDLQCKGTISRKVKVHLGGKPKLDNYGLLQQ
ncbi:uncharacterized protein LODBEIA_P16130 [Lodderomyces beijingensis]|uniref:Uncharacterized protein n=1 Tax=Lodderomyces beijingensis TaxID=1775926 RepID=A0ABP0ZGU8_9ASCO